MAVRLRIQVTTIRELEAAVMGLAWICWSQMEDAANAGRIPPLYSGRIRYQREPEGREDWQTAIETARLGTADCEDLCGYRLGELFLAGETKARARVVAITPTLRHVLVMRGDGRLEDPSRRLGMGIRKVA